jgi:hypothetical protein
MELVVPALCSAARGGAVAAFLQQGRAGLDRHSIFYWYQLLWVLIGAALTAIVYFATDE